MPAATLHVQAGENSPEGDGVQAGIVGKVVVPAVSSSQDLKTGRGGSHPVERPITTGQWIYVHNPKPVTDYTQVGVWVLPPPPSDLIGAGCPTVHSSGNEWLFGMGVDGKDAPPSLFHQLKSFP